MPKKFSQKPNKPARKCIFCHSGNLSKEHLWPDWASPLLPPSLDNRNSQQLRITENTHLVKPPEFKVRQGSLWTTKLRVVCASCNNGWMSALENKAKPILIPMIDTKSSHDLSADHMLILSQWITLNIMVLDQHNPEL